MGIVYFVWDLLVFRWDWDLNVGLMLELKHKATQTIEWSDINWFRDNFVSSGCRYFPAGSTQLFLSYGNGPVISDCPNKLPGCWARGSVAGVADSLSGKDSSLREGAFRCVGLCAPLSGSPALQPRVVVAARLYPVLYTLVHCRLCL